MLWAADFADNQNLEHLLAINCQSRTRQREPGENHAALA